MLPIQPLSHVNTDWLHVQYTDDFQQAIVTCLPALQVQFIFPFNMKKKKKPNLKILPKTPQALDNKPQAFFTMCVTVALAIALTVAA